MTNFTMIFCAIANGMLSNPQNANKPAPALADELENNVRAFYTRHHTMLNGALNAAAGAQPNVNLATGGSVNPADYHIAMGRSADDAQKLSGQVSSATLGNMIKQDMEEQARVEAARVSKPVS